MSDHVFKSKYSMEEIENNFKDVEGLEDSLCKWEMLL